MKKRFTDEQIVKLIKEHEAGKSATDISREPTFLKQLSTAGRRNIPA